MQITIGTDPEVFVRDSSGTYFSVEDKNHGKLIPGTKLSPHPVECGAIQRDGVALEFNTVPAKTADEFVQYIDTVIKEMTAVYKAVRPDLEIVMTPTAHFSREYFDSLPEEVKLLGCSPDYNAYTGGENEKPETDEPFRTGSGHIHVGWTRYENPHDDDHFASCMGMVRQLDCVLYPVSLLWDSDDKRRTLYGKIGAFRPKEYGVEYRPLSNAFLSSQEIQRYVFSVTKRAAEDFFAGIHYEDDHECYQMVERLRNSVSISQSELLEYAGYVCDKFHGVHYE